MKYFADQLNEIKLDHDRISPMERFTGTTADTTLKYHHVFDLT